MKCLPLLFGPLFAFALGCNTAQISQPATVDAGPPCVAKPAVVTCDAGAPTPGACPGSVTLVLNYPDASNTVPAGSYPLGCTLGFFVQDPASPDCLRASPCTCVSPDAGGDDAGVAPGVWSCFPAQ